MDKYKPIKQLGVGTFGVVTKAVNTQTQEVVAIKLLKQEITWDEALQLREVKALRVLNAHPNCVKIKEMALNQGKLNVVFEYCEKNLLQQMQDRAQRNQPYTNEEVRSLISQTLQALQYVHQKGYMHRDCKPENFLVTEQGVLKLADFGLATQAKTDDKLTEYVSTRWYRAPELALETSKYGPAVDVFAVGAIMAELYLQRPIFPGRSSHDQFSTIVGVMGPVADWPEGLRIAKGKNITFSSEKGNFD